MVESRAGVGAIERPVIAPFVIASTTDAAYPSPGAVSNKAAIPSGRTVAVPTMTRVPLLYTTSGTSVGWFSSGISCRDIICSELSNLVLSSPVTPAKLTPEPFGVTVLRDTAQGSIRELAEVLEVYGVLESKLANSDCFSPEKPLGSAGGMELAILSSK